jgi:hypothetical protein
VEAVLADVPREERECTAGLEAEAWRTGEASLERERMEGDDPGEGRELLGGGVDM